MTYTDLALGLGTSGPTGVTNLPQAPQAVEMELSSLRDAVIQEYTAFLEYIASSMTEGADLLQGAEGKGLLGVGTDLVGVALNSMALWQLGGMTTEMLSLAAASSTPVGIFAAATGLTILMLHESAQVSDNMLNLADGAGHISVTGSLSSYSNFSGSPNPLTPDSTSPTSLPLSLVRQLPDYVSAIVRDSIPGLIWQAGVTANIVHSSITPSARGAAVRSAPTVYDTFQSIDFTVKPIVKL